MFCRHHSISLVINRRRFVTNANPLRVDPTRTTMIRRRFVADMRRRFGRLKKALRKFLVEEDALGLKAFTTRIVLHEDGTVNEFNPDEPRDDRGRWTTGGGGGKGEEGQAQAGGGEKEVEIPAGYRTEWKASGVDRHDVELFNAEGQSIGHVNVLTDLDGGKTVQTEDLEIWKEFRGQGNAKILYKGVMLNAKAQGFTKMASSQSLQEGGEAVWLSLQKEGFSVIKEGGRYWADEVFLLDLSSIKAKGSVANSALTLHQEREFQFRADAGKLQAFNDWLRQQMEATVLSRPAGLGGTGPWTAPYIESAYKKGIINAYLASKEGLLMTDLGIGEQTQEQFLRSAFTQGEAVGKVQLLATRAFEDLKGVTSAMSSQMNRILAQGMIDGTGPAVLAKEMSDTIDNLTDRRALLIARTETISAHAEGQLDSFEKLGVEELGVKAEFSTAADDRVCPECEELEGEVFDIDEARGIIPVHVSCRCSWIPFVPAKLTDQ